MTKSQATTTIPVQLSGPEFIAFIFPHGVVQMGVTREAGLTLAERMMAR